MNKITCTVVLSLFVLGLAAMIPRSGYADGGLLTTAWHLVGNNGDAQLYQPVAANALLGHTSLTVTYDLHGLCLLGGDASALIFDQNGWKFVSLANYGQNCKDGPQTVTVPLSAFGLDLTQVLTGSFHVRIWHQGTWTVDITAAVLDGIPPPYPTPYGTPYSTPYGTPYPTPYPTPSSGVIPQHMVVVIEENHDYNQVVGAMPYLNRLASQYALATRWYANTHPSVGNYFELVTGNIVTDDDDFSPTDVQIDNMVRNLPSGKTWKVYAEDLPSVGYIGGDAGGYVRHHNPFSYLKDVTATNQRNNMVPFSQFAIDMANNALPNVSFVIPNGQHNGHDNTLALADSWLQNNVGPVFNSSQFQQDGLLVVTFDEADVDETSGGGKVYTVLAGQNVKTGYQSTTFYQHQSLLRMMLKSLGATRYPGDAAYAPDMTEFFR